MRRLLANRSVRLQEMAFSLECIVRVRVLHKADRAGVVGISSLIAERRIQEQNTGNLPSGLREAAFERAAVQILDKLQGHSVVGVVLYDC